MANFPLSAYIIVKDSLNSLAEVIESIKNIASELIIINAGTAETKEYINKVVNNYGNFPLQVQVYDYPWQDDYSRLKNYALGYAGQPWILSLESDYVLADGSRNKISICLEKADISLFYLKFTDNQLTIEEQKKIKFANYIPPDFEVVLSQETLNDSSRITLRGALFRNGKGISYKGRVYENLIGSESLKAEIADIYFYNFNCTEQARREKEQETVRLLQIALNEPGNISDKLFYQYKLLNLNFNNLNNAKDDILRLNKMLKTYQPNVNKFEQWYSDSTAYLLSNNELSLSLEILLEASDQYPDYLGILYNFSQWLFMTAKVFEGIQVLKYIIYLNKSQKALKPSPYYDVSFSARLTDIDYLNYRVALCYYEFSDYSAAEYYFKLITDLSRFQADHQKLLAALNGTISFVPAIKEQIINGNNFILLEIKLAREYLLDQNYEMALSTYNDALTKASGEEDIVLEKLIISDLLRYGKALIPEPETVTNLISRGKKLSRTYSYFWYSLGIYYWSLGEPEMALAAWVEAENIELRLEQELPGLSNRTAGINQPFIDRLIIRVNDDMIKEKVHQAINLAKSALTSLAGNNNFIQAVLHWQNKEKQKAVDYWLLTGPQNDFEQFIVNDYLALAFERLADFDKAAIYSAKAYDYYPDDFVRQRETKSLYKKYKQIYDTATGDFGMLQLPGEWIETLKTVDAVKPEVILEIGTYRGGTIYTLSQLVNNGLVISIDLPGGAVAYGNELSAEEVIILKEKMLEKSPGNEIHFIKADSHLSETLEQVKKALNGKKVNVLFFDGDHSYEGVKQDFEMYSPLVAQNGLIITHDIQPLNVIFEDSEHNAFWKNVTGDRFWREISLRYKVKEIIDDKNQRGYGIGVIFKTEPETDYLSQSQELLTAHDPAYFDLLKKLLTDTLNGSSPEAFINGQFTFTRAVTMIGFKRLNNLQFCIEDLINNGVEGDLLEAGVWRGGATIFMRAVLKFYGVKDKKVYVADSFQGLPEPDTENYPLDYGSNFHEIPYLTVSEEEVKSNFQKFMLLDEQVEFISGWFKESFVAPPFEKLALLRFDGDMYSSAWETLTLLYDKVSPGGYIIIDDYGLAPCKAAVDYFRLTKKINEPMHKIDWAGAYWQKGKTGSATPDMKNNNISFASRVNINRSQAKKIYGRYNIVSQPVMQKVYEDISELLINCFSELGIDHNTSFKELRAEYNNILLFPYCSPEFVEYASDFTFIPFQMEQLITPFLNSVVKPEYLKMLNNADLIWDYSDPNIDYLNSIGITNAAHLPFGFQTEMEVLSFDREKTIDVLFYGALNQRRIDILNELNKKGYKVKALHDVFGRERNAYIEKAKIILNIHHYEVSLLEEYRLSFLLNNRCFVISEQVKYPVGKEYNSGVVFCPYDEIVSTVEYYLLAENEFLRKQIAEKGYNEFSGCRMTDNLKRVLP